MNYFEVRYFQTGRQHGTTDSMSTTVFAHNNRISKAGGRSIVDKHPDNLTLSLSRWQRINPIQIWVRDNPRKYLSNHTPSVSSFTPLMTERKRSIITVTHFHLYDRKKREKSAQSFQCGRNNGGISRSSDMWRYCSRFSSGGKHILWRVGFTIQYHKKPPSLTEEWFGLWEKVIW